MVFKRVIKWHRRTKGKTKRRRSKNYRWMLSQQDRSRRMSPKRCKQSLLKSQSKKLSLKRRALINRFNNHSWYLESTGSLYSRINQVWWIQLIRLFSTMRIILMCSKEDPKILSSWPDRCQVQWHHLSLSTWFHLVNPTTCTSSSNHRSQWASTAKWCRCKIYQESPPSLQVFPNRSTETSNSNQTILQPQPSLKINKNPKALIRMGVRAPVGQTQPARRPVNQANRWSNKAQALAASSKHGRNLRLDSYIKVF